MASSRISFRQFGTFFLVYYFYIWIAPSVRILLFGTGASTGIADSLITLLPDLILLGFLAFVFIGMRRDERKWNWSSLTLFDKCFAVFWLSNVILGFILAMAPKYSMLGFRVTYLPMMMYMAGRFFSGDNGLVRRIINGIIFITALFSLVGIFLYFVFPSLAANVATSSGYEQGKYFIARMTSVLWTPVLFGTMVMIAAVLTVYRIVTEKWNAGYVFFALFWFCLFMTVSRGPIIAFLLALIVITVILKSWKSSGILFGTVLVISMSVSFVAVGNLSMMKWIFKSTGETLALDSNVTRVDRWAETWKDFKARPYGYGLGKAGSVAFRYFVNTDVPSAPYSTDGWLLKTACETGIYGFASYLLLCIVFFVRAINKMRFGVRGILVAALALFLATNAQTIISNVYDFFPYIGIYWMILGIAEVQKESDSIR